MRLGRIGRALLAAALMAPLLGGAGRRPAPKPQYGPPPPPTPYDMCEDATVAARGRLIPETLLGAMARVESGRTDPATGRVRPWPWTINVDGIGYFFGTKDEAVAAVQALQAKGTKSIDVGCLQVNLYYHPTAFADLEAAFDPVTNAGYAASFLLALHAQSKDWALATAAYHSQTQERGEDYQRRVFGRVVTPMGPPTAFSIPGQKWPPPGTVFGALPPSSTLFGAFAPADTQFGAFSTSPLFQPTPGLVPSGVGLVPKRR